VDPFVQFPVDSQSANAYSYILNNPLSGTDPSGYLTDLLDDDNMPTPVRVEDDGTTTTTTYSDGSGFEHGVVSGNGTDTSTPNTTAGNEGNVGKADDTSTGSNETRESSSGSG